MCDKSDVLLLVLWWEGWKRLIAHEVGHMPSPTSSSKPQATFYTLMNPPFRPSDAFTLHVPPLEVHRLTRWCLYHAVQLV